jgi:hypothetical protein
MMFTPGPTTRFLREGTQCHKRITEPLRMTDWGEADTVEAGLFRSGDEIVGREKTVVREGVGVGVEVDEQGGSLDLRT